MMLRAFGVALGSNVNEADDALAFVPFGRDWIGPAVLDRTGRDRLSKRKRERLTRDLNEAVRSHLDDVPLSGAPWGWKLPPTLFILPLLDEQFPEMRFIHVVRDPRDMAFSENRNQAKRWGPLYLSKSERAEPIPVQMALLWKRVNNDAKTYGGSMGARYLLVRYEDLCLDPRRSGGSLAAWLNLKPGDESLRQLSSLVTVPSSIGRWKKQDARLVERIGSLLQNEVGAYGYDDEEWLARVEARIGAG
jgi:hypothetical protein